MYRCLVTNILHTCNLEDSRMTYNSRSLKIILQLYRSILTSPDVFVCWMMMLFIMAAWHFTSATTKGAAEDGFYAPEAWGGKISLWVGVTEPIKRPKNLMMSRWHSKGWCHKLSRLDVYYVERVTSGGILFYCNLPIHPLRWDNKVGGRQSFIAIKGATKG